MCHTRSFNKSDCLYGFMIDRCQRANYTTSKWNWTLVIKSCYARWSVTAFADIQITTTVSLVYTRYTRCIYMYQSNTRCIYQVYIPGISVYTWYTPGVYTWCIHLVYTPGVYTWCIHLVYTRYIPGVWFDKSKKSWKMGSGPGSPWMFNFRDSPHPHKQETRGLDTIQTTFFLFLLATTLLSRKFWGKGRFVKK